MPLSPISWPPLTVSIGIPNSVLRSNALGAFQAEVGIWQILARQKQIPTDRLNASWEGAIQPYGGISSSSQLFEAAQEIAAGNPVAAGGSAEHDRRSDGRSARRPRAE